MDYAQLIKPLSSIIQKRVPSLVAIYWFGSTRNGCANRESDIDLALLGKKKFPLPVLYKIKQVLERASPLPVDLLDLRALPTVVQFEIIQDSTVVFCKENDAESAFEDYVWLLYLRLIDFRKPFLDAQRKRYAG
ncbi:MAG: nucleotidyltransferase domain-containing protein [Gammaproteobacteria bacterium]|nr:nucleotidyltransferase domain-containing protein [Gammaproteobacteria bacterium]